MQDDDNQEDEYEQENGDEGSEDFEEDAEEERVQPPQQRPPQQRSRLMTLSNDEFKDEIFSYFDQDPNITVPQVYQRLLDNGYGNDLGDPFGMPKIGATKKSWLTTRRKEREKLAAQNSNQQQYHPSGVTPAPISLSPQAAKSMDDLSALRPPSKLEILTKNLQIARETGDKSMIAIWLDLLYKEIDKNDNKGGGGDDWAKNLAGTIITGMVTNKPPVQNTMKQLNEAADLLIKLKGPETDRGQESETVAMTREIGKMVTHGVDELKDTALTIAGKPNVADMFGVCPNCQKPVLKDSNLCNYCGVRFRADPQAGVYPAAPPGQMSAPQEGGSGMKHRQLSGQAPQGPSAAPQQQAPQGMTDKQKDTLRDYAKRIANMVASKEDPDSAVGKMYFFMGEEDKNLAMVVAGGMGMDRLKAAIEIMAPQFPDIANEINILRSPDGLIWINKAIEGLKARLREEIDKGKLTKLKAEDPKVKAIKTRIENMLNIQL